MTNKIVPLGLVFLLYTGAAAPLAAAPPWVDRKPADTAETLYFRALAEAERREDAEQSAINNLHAEAARYMLVSVRASNSENSQTDQYGVDGEIRERYTGEFKSEIESHTGMLLSGIQTEVYSEQYAGRRWRAALAGLGAGHGLPAEAGGGNGCVSGTDFRSILCPAFHRRQPCGGHP
jgi:hypothetical protein